MWKFRSVFGLFCFVLLCSSTTLTGGRSSKRRWQTLHGSAPLVIANGGFSGIFADSSSVAYSLAVQSGLPNLLVSCDLMLTKDDHGICFPNIMLQNSSDIDFVYPNRSSSYIVNGVQTKGFFSVDFNYEELGSVSLTQGIYSRPPNFDYCGLQITTPDEFIDLSPSQPSGVWLNIPYDKFFTQHGLNMSKYVVDLLKTSAGVGIKYVSSPEVDFLTRLRKGVGRRKLVFQLLGPNETEPTTNRTYASFLSNLEEIREFADGIVVQKSYVWAVDKEQYLMNYTSLVSDAHRAGLEVFASGFANDAQLPYNYSYDPVSEYLSFIDNGVFCVDGVLSDFPLTPSATIANPCLPLSANFTIIANEGANGDYPGCTDVAYEKAVSDGANILRCPVQITNDGVPICLGSINLFNGTNVVQSPYLNRAADNHELGIKGGLFVYNFTWTEIKTLRPQISSPYKDGFGLFRNPRAINDGKLMQLSDFLAFANSQSSVSGVMISIENAAYLAEKQGLSVTDAVNDALKGTTSKRVLIESSDSSVLMKMSRERYEMVYVVDEDVSDVAESTISEIRGFAGSVIVSKRSVYPTDAFFVIGETDLVERLQKSNLTVYVRLFRNEFLAQPWDFLSDPYFEINSYVSKGINGLITDFPATPNKYARNRCLKYSASDRPLYMQSVQVGGLMQLMTTQSRPPAEAPIPVLTDDNVTEPPLPSVVVRRPTPPPLPPPAMAPTPSQHSGQPTLVTNTALAAVLMLAASVW
ncbi:Glycerophosphodiester phosphodiesterase GDPDL4 [Striga hermonthica]|uniref:glycerophosphodiester phosphodiesterase n=1 Tax=Striga hermonthica TaxID=68872 RepID=A0A9N7MVI3_STRHE|nr:Glycerophosphodiester phosphodiesterase GDPDL4 [Striga hermonthica]